ncbi:MAG: hypothetical protein KGL95_10790, partial [Patescibacteria group bacterium]|nr:hypothetical protein [Patescibacteria group bacterium]
MNPKKIQPINQTTFHILYFKYKIYFVPIGAFIVAILLLLNVVLPEIQQWYSDQDKIAQIEAKIDVLNKSLNTVNNLDSKALDANLKTATNALPDGKDFIGVLTAVSSAAQDSGTSVNDYAFQVGDLTNKKIQKDTFLQITVSLKGNIDHIRQFVSALKNQFPLSRITEIHIAGNQGASLTIIFFYKPFPQIAFSGNDVLLPLTDKEEKTITSLQNISLGNFNTASDSAS